MKIWIENKFLKNGGNYHNCPQTNSLNRYWRRFSSSKFRGNFYPFPRFTAPARPIQPILHNRSAPSPLSQSSSFFFFPQLFPLALCVFIIGRLNLALGKEGRPPLYISLPRQNTVSLRNRKTTDTLISQ